LLIVVDLRAYPNNPSWLWDYRFALNQSARIWKIGHGFVWVWLKNLMCRFA
jgi:hypothetical protein